MPNQLLAPRSPIQEPDAPAAPAAPDDVEKLADPTVAMDIGVVAAEAAHRVIDSSAPTPGTPAPPASVETAIPEGSFVSAAKPETVPLDPVTELAQKVRLLCTQAATYARTDPSRDQLIAREDQPRGVTVNDRERANGIITSGHVVRALHEQLHTDYVSGLSGAARAKAEAAISPDNLLVFLVPTLDSLQHSSERLVFPSRADRAASAAFRTPEMSQQQLAAAKSIYSDVSDLKDAIRREYLELVHQSKHYQWRRYKPTHEIIRQFSFSSYRRA